MQELKDELQSRGLDASGLKAVLVERLEEAVSAEAGCAANGSAAEPAAEVAAPEPVSAAEDARDAEPAEEVGRLAAWS